MRRLRMKEPRGLTQEEIDIRIEQGKLKRLRNKKKKKQKKPYQSPVIIHLFLILVCFVFFFCKKWNC